MCFVRLPVDREGLHLIPLYDEQPVVVVAKENPVAAYDEIDVADLADEHLLQDPDDVPAWRDVATEVADGTRYPVPGDDAAAGRRERRRGRRHRDRADVGGPAAPPQGRRRRPGDRRRRPPTVGLAWPVDNDDDRVETFIGVVRGRSANSTRS